jgi:protein-S-isoprenylcysteine O-methyltransferase Ste14
MNPKVILFVVLSAGLLLVSGRSLKVPGSHGFYRFFAWEAMLALTLLNIGVWFSDPLSLRQLMSWFFLSVSALIAVPGFFQLMRHGRPNNLRDDPTLMDFEKTSELVTSGIYGSIRHPLYGSLLFLAWGVFFKDITWASAGLVVGSTVFLVATAKADEVECVRHFGEPYRDYMKRTKMFIPFLF